MDWLTSSYHSFINDVNGLDITFTNAVFRMMLSMTLGMAVGFERKRKGQVAGVRTFALMSLGACVAMLLSIYVPQVYSGLKNGDPSRIAAQVITGVGFIGGGVMIHTKGAVRGLTTAAGIWITSVIGMAVGVGMYSCAIAATLLCVIILMAVESYGNNRLIGQENKVLNVVANSIITDTDCYRELFKQSRIHLSTYYIEYLYEKNTTIINFVVLVPVKSDLLPVIDKMRRLSPTASITLSSHIDI